MTPEQRDRCAFLLTLKMNKHFQEGIIKQWSEPKFRHYGSEIREAKEMERVYRAQGALDVLDSFMEIFRKAEQAQRKDR